MERQSLKCAFFTINKLNDSVIDEGLEARNEYRLYEIKYSIASCYKDQPIPFEFQKRR